MYVIINKYIMYTYKLQYVNTNTKENLHKGNKHYSSQVFILYKYGIKRRRVLQNIFIVVYLGSNISYL